MLTYHESNSQQDLEVIADIDDIREELYSLLPPFVLVGPFWVVMQMQMALFGQEDDPASKEERKQGLAGKGDENA